MQLSATLRHFTLLYATLRYFIVFRQTPCDALGKLAECFIKMLWDELSLGRVVPH